MAYSLASNAVLAKARAMYGNRILPSEYEKLSSSASLSQAFSFLKGHKGYKACFEGYDLLSLHRAQAEEELRREIFIRYLKLVRYAGNFKNGFYGYFIKYCEISEILNCLSYLFRNRTDDYIFSLPTYLVKYASFDLMQLARANKISDVRNCFVHTPYLKVIDSVEKKENVTLLDYETAFYKYYYESIFKEIENDFRFGEKKQLIDIFMMRAELYNVLFILRAKAFFKLPEKTVRENILPYRFYLSKQKLNEMITADGYKKSVAVLKNTKYDKKDALFPIDFMEQSYKKLISAQSSKLIRFSSSPAVVLAAYMSFCDIETANLFSIIEGLRYELDADDINSLLIY